MATQLFLIRHGETQWSLAGRHTGRTDLPLTENGERAAERLRALLRGLAFARVFTSPLQRARQTCERAGLGATAQMEPELHEWDYGDYEGLTSAAIRAVRPGWNVFRDGCPRGESAEQISLRADRLLSSLRPIEGAVALFSHGQFLRVLAVRWIGLPVRAGGHLGFDAASLGILGHDPHNGDIPVVSVWNAGSDAPFAQARP